MPDPASQGTGTDPVSGHRASRDRFAAFALAAADLLIEVGVDQRIVYIAGAARALTSRDARELVGRQFRDLFAESHRDFARSLLHRVRRNQRMEPVEVDFERDGNPVNVVLRGCCLPGRPDTLYFTASRSIALEAADTAHLDEETGLLAGPAFQKTAAAARSRPTAPCRHWSSASARDRSRLPDAARAEGVRIRNDSDQRAGEQRSNPWDVHESTTHLRSSCTGHDSATGLQNLGTHQPELIDQHDQAFASRFRHTLIRLTNAHSRGIAHPHLYSMAGSVLERDCRNAASGHMHFGHGFCR